MTVNQLEHLLRAANSTDEVRFLVPALTIEPGDKLPITARRDADNSFLIEIDAGDLG